jgi:hypothetical protein
MIEPNNSNLEDIDDDFHDFVNFGYLNEMVKHKNAVFMNKLKIILKEYLFDKYIKSDSYNNFETDIVDYFYSDKIIYPIHSSVRVILSDKYSLSRLINYFDNKIKQYYFYDKKVTSVSVNRISEQIINQICKYLIKKSASESNLVFFSD